MDTRKPEIKVLASSNGKNINIFLFNKYHQYTSIYEEVSFKGVPTYLTLFKMLGKGTMGTEEECAYNGFFNYGDSVFFHSYNHENGHYTIVQKYKYYDQEIFKINLTPYEIRVAVTEYELKFGELD